MQDKVNKVVVYLEVDNVLPAEKKVLVKNTV